MIVLVMPHKCTLTLFGLDYSIIYYTSMHISLDNISIKVSVKSYSILLS